MTTDLIFKTNPSPTERLLNFNPLDLTLIDSGGQFHSLDITQLPKSESFWKNWTPEGETLFTQLNLGDLPCRIEPTDFYVFIKRIWELSDNNAKITFRIPHPRHDIFMMDLGYVRGLLPESFMTLDPIAHPSPMANQLGVNFEFIDANFELDENWQKAIEAKEISNEELELISFQAANVIQWITIELRVRKSPWKPLKSNVNLTAEMQLQLQEQMKSHISRGDHAAAATIKKFLEGNFSN